MKGLTASRCQFSLKTDPVAVQTHRGMVITNNKGEMVAVFDMNGFMIAPTDLRGLTPGLSTFVVNDWKD